MAQASTTTNRPKNKVRVDVTRADVSEIKIVDTDLVLTLKDGRKLYVGDGAIQSMMDQEFAVEFADGSALGGQELLQAAGEAEVTRIGVSGAQGSGGEAVVAQAPAATVPAAPPPAAEPAKSGGFKSWLAIGTPLVGGLLGGVLGGGGGAAAAGAVAGGDNGSTANVKTNTPVISVVALDDKVSASEKNAAVTVSGTAEANATVTVVWGATTKTATASASGAWSTSFSATEVPADAVGTTLSATAKTSTGLTSDPAVRTIQVDSTAPNAPLIATIAGDNTVGPTEKNSGVTVTGTAEPGSAVTVNWATTSKTVLTDPVGNWSVTFASNEVPAAGAYTITATASDALGNVSSAGSNAVTVSPAITVQGVITAGPVIPGNGLSVSIFSGTGALIASGITVAADGTYVASGLPLAPNEPFVVRVIDASAGADYNDEATNAPKDLNANLFAAAVVEGSNVANVTVNVNPLTTIAAIKAGLSFDGTGTLASPAVVNNSKQAVAQAFGLSGIDIVKETPAPTNGGQYNPADGLSTGERVGAVLAALSGADSDNGGDSQATITTIAAGVTVSGTSGTLSEAAAAQIVAGALKADAVTPGALSAVVSDGLASAGGTQVTIAPLTADNIVTAAEAVGLAITGTTPVGTSTVWVQIGTGSFAATIDGGSWSYTLKAADLTLLGADGSKVVKATATLSDGTTATASRPIILSATPPSAPTLAAIATDNIVNLAERTAGISVSGTATAGNTVTVELGSVTKTSVVGSNGAWSVNFSTAELPSSGSVTVKATVSDSFGNLSPSTTQPLSFQTTTPAAPTIAVVAGDDLVGPTEKTGGITVSGTGAPGGKVTLTFGNLTRVVNVDANGAWSSSFTPSQIPEDGDYTLTAVTTDPAGNASVTVSRDIRVDATAPAAPVINAVATDNVINAAEKLNGVNVRGTTEPNANVEVTWGAVTKTAKANAAGQWVTTFTSTQVPNDGQYTITAVATDPSGNVSSTGSRNVTVDTSNLAPVITSIGNGTVINANQKTAGVLVTGTAEAGANVQVTFGTTTQQVVANAQGNWQTVFSGNAIPEASSATVVAQSTDPAGNQSLSTSSTVSIDTVLPAKPVIDVVSVDDVVGTGDFASGVQVTGSAEAGTTVQVVWDGITKTTTADSIGKWSVTYGNADKPTDGTKNIVVRATDAAGNISLAEQRSVVVDTIASVPTIATVAGNNVIGAAERAAGVAVSGTSDPNAVVTVTWNGIQKQATASTSGQWTVSYASSEIPVSGSSQITATAVDIGGNVNTSQPRNVVVDTVAAAPTITTLSTDNLIGAPEIANGIEISGTAEAGASVTVVWGTQQRGTIADQNGAWKVIFEAASVPSDGATTVTASIVDLGGNTSTTTSLPVTIDRQAPGAPTIDAISIDNLVSASEKAAGVTVSGTAEANATVVVQWGTATRTVTAGATGAWTTSFGSADLNQEGAITVSATQTDSAGNPSAAGTRIVTVDTVAPAPPTIDVVAGNNIVNESEKNAGVTITGTALPGAPVNVTWGSVTLPATADATTGIWSVTFSASQVPADGTRPVSATQRDPAGNESLKAELPVVVDTTPASAATISIVSGNDLINATERAAGVTVSGTAPANSTVAVNWNGVTKTLNSGAAGTWSAVFNPTEIPTSGTTTITATPTSASGNVGIAAVRTVTVDQVAPGAPTILTVSNDNQISGAEKAAGVTVEGTGEPGGKVTVIWGSTTLSNIDVDTNGNWSVLFTSAQIPADGSSSIRAFQTDAAGNVGPESSPTSVVVDTTAPSAPTLAAVAGDNRVNLAESTGGFTISGTAEANATITVTWGNSTRTTVANGAGAWQLTYNSSQIPAAGTVTMSVTQRDVAGNTSAPTNRSVLIDLTAPNPPVISNVSAGTLVSAAERTSGVTITGTTEAGSTVAVTWGGTTRNATVTGTTWTVTFTGSQIPGDGSFPITAIATDVAGNASVASSVDATIDTIAPGAPVINIVAGDGRVSGAEKTAGVDVTGTAEANATVAVTWGSTTKTVTANASGAWTANFTGNEIPADGSTTVSAVQTDAAGNPGTLQGTRTVTVDTVAPVAPAIPGMTNKFGAAAFSTDRDTVQVAGTGEVGATITVFVNGVSAGTAIVDAKGVWLSPNLSVPGAAGTTATVTVQQTDLAGNVSAVATQQVTKATVASTTFRMTLLTSGSGFALRGEGQFDQLGLGIAVGDVNGDGLADFMAGARGDDGGLDAGEVYVVFGQPGGLVGKLTSGRLVADVTSLPPAEGFVIQGDSAGDLLYNVAYIGDVNGDGVGDIVVSGDKGDDGGSDAGEAYVIFGKSNGSFGTVDATGRSVVDLTTLNPSDGFVIQGDAAGDNAGFAVTALGDINKDGFADFAVGAPTGDDGGSNAGETYVIFGKASGLPWGTVDATGRSVIDLTSLGTSQGFVIQGDTADDRSGYSISAAGDVNGDGVDDIIIGAYLGDDGGSAAGEAYVIFGKAGGVFGNVDATGRRVIDLTSLSPTDGYVIQGAQAGDQLGIAVSAAGDVNGDGVDDLLIGANGRDTDANQNTGLAYVVFGKTGTPPGSVDGSGRRVLNLVNLTPSQGFVMGGFTAQFDNFGGAVAGGGDLNGDGYDDIAISARGFDLPGATDIGAVFVVFGKGAGAAFGTVDANGQAFLNMSTLSPADGIVLQGFAAGDQFGTTVEFAPDSNGDGTAELFVGGQLFNSPTKSDVGEVYAIFGKKSWGGLTLTGTTAADFLIGSDANDSLAGEGGADVLLAGLGNDTLSVANSAFSRIDGGAGTDILVVSAAGLSLNLSTIAAGTITGIEQIDLNGFGANTLTITRDTLLALSDTSDTLIVNLGADDTVSAAGFTATGATQTINGVQYTVYSNSGATLLVQAGVGTVTLPPPPPDFMGANFGSDPFGQMVL